MAWLQGWYFSISFVCGRELQLTEDQDKHPTHYLNAMNPSDVVVFTQSCGNIQNRNIYHGVYDEVPHDWTGAPAYGYTHLSLWHEL